MPAGGGIDGGKERYCQLIGLLDFNRFKSIIDLNRTIELIVRFFPWPTPESPFAVSHTPHIIHDIWTVGQRSILKSLQPKSSKVYISYYVSALGGT